MKKELLVTLLKKDIAELAQMTDGFNELDFFPVALLNLAKDKADNIKKCLDELSVLSKTKTQHSVKIEPEISSQTTVAPEIVDTPSNSEVIEVEVPTPIETPKVMEQKNEDIVATQPIEEEKIEKEEPVEDENVEEDGFCDNEEEEYDDSDDLLEESESVEISFAEVKANEKETSLQSMTRSDQLQNQKVEDIKQAISIGDRFLFQRELFKNSGELLSKTITAINACRTIDEAQSYLRKKFNWDYENPTTERFMQIVARKFN